MKKHEEARIVNTKTGEVKDGYFIYVAHPKAKIKNQRFVMTFQDSLITISKDKELTGEMKSVLLFLMGNLEFDNYITIKQVEIAKELEMQKTNVSRAMRLLVSKKIILKVKEGTTTGYKLNPTYGWKGKVENMEKTKAEMEADKIIDFQEARERQNPSQKSGIASDEIPY